MSAEASAEGNAQVSGENGSAASGQDPAAGRRPDRSGTGWRFTRSLLLAAIVGLLLRVFVLQTFVIPSGSMENTLRPADRVVVDKLSIRLGSLHRGDVIVFAAPASWRQPGERDYIKRLVGLPGDRVACCDDRGRVTVNGTPLDEPYLYPGDDPSEEPFAVTVPAGRLFVLGDHRSVSADSRRHQSDSHGTIPRSSVVGRALLVIWPLGDWSVLRTPDTFEGIPAARRDGHAVR